MSRRTPRGVELAIAADDQPRDIVMLPVLAAAGLLILLGALILNHALQADRRTPVEPDRPPARAGASRERRAAPAPSSKPAPDTPPFDSAGLPGPDPLIDPGALQRLRDADAGQGAPVLAALIDAFLTGGAAQLDTIDTLLRDSDHLRALSSLGLFRTSARLLGASPLDRRGQSMQDAIDIGDTGAAQATLDTLRQDFHRAAAELRRYQGLAA